MRSRLPHGLITGLVALMLASCALCAHAAPVETPLWQFSPREHGSGAFSINVHALPQTGIVWFKRDAWPGRASILTPDGQHLANVSLCSRCGSLFAAADGGVWAVEFTSNFQGTRWALRRYNAMGDSLQTLDLSRFARTLAIAVLPDGADFDVLVLPGYGEPRMRLFRVAADGTRGPLRVIQMSNHQGLGLVDHRRAADGGMTLLLDRGVASFTCPSAIPCGWEPRVSVVGLSAIGVERWRVEPNWPSSSKVLGRGMDEQGRSWIVRSSAEGARLLIVDADGVQSEERILQSGIGSSQFIGPIGGFGMMRNGVYMVLFDEYGALQASRLVSTCYMTQYLEHQEYVITPFGYLLSRCQGVADNFDVTLFDPQTLATRAEFDVDGQAVAYNSYHRALGHWLALPDGSLYAAVEDDRGAHLAKFAIPGTPAHRPFGNGFEAQP